MADTNLDENWQKFVKWCESVGYPAEHGVASNHMWEAYKAALRASREPVGDDCRKAFNAEFPDYADIANPCCDTPEDARSAWFIWRTAWQARTQSHDKLRQETATVSDYEATLADHRRLVRELDVALHGEDGAAKQASLCDLIAPAKEMACKLRLYEEAFGGYENLAELMAKNKEYDRLNREYIAKLRRAEARIAELEGERNEADRRAGAAEREMENLKDSALKRMRWLDEAKDEAGYSRKVSFDIVWKETLAKALTTNPAPAQPLTGEERKNLLDALSVELLGNITIEQCAESALSTIEQHYTLQRRKP